MLFKYIRQKAYEKKLRALDVPDVFRSCFEQVKNLETRKHIRDIGFIVFDTETTGLRPARGDVLLSIGALGFTGGRVDLSKSFYELIRPEREIPRDSVLVHTLTPGKMKDLSPVSDVLVRFLEFCQGAVLVGHHTAFDVEFINAALKKYFGLPLANRVLDTAKIARGIQKTQEPSKVAIEGARNFSLDYLAKSFNIKAPDRHDAYADALVTALIFQRQIALLQKEGMSRLKDFLRIGEVR